jgi:hypothetical protein
MSYPIFRNRFNQTAQFRHLFSSSAVRPSRTRFKRKLADGENDHQFIRIIWLYIGTDPHSKWVRKPPSVTRGCNTLESKTGRITLGKTSEQIWAKSPNQTQSIHVISVAYILDLLLIVIFQHDQSGYLDPW